MIKGMSVLSSLVWLLWGVKRLCLSLSKALSKAV